MVDLSTNQKFDAKAGPVIGVGLRPKHYPNFLAEKKPDGIDFTEVITENYLNHYGRALYNLDRIAESLPIYMHGVTLSIGSTDALNFDYLDQVKQLSKRCGAVLISDHLCWTGVHGINTHDLLPLPYDEETLTLLVHKIKQVQDFLEQPLVIENPSSYVEFHRSTMSEWEFLAHMCHESGCKLLLDINNVYVSAKNHGFDPHLYMTAMKPEWIAQYHLAGHTDFGTHILDTHVGPLPTPVLDLYQYTLQKLGSKPTLIEWDEDIPDFAVLQTECRKVRAIVNKTCFDHDRETRDDLYAP